MEAIKSSPSIVFSPNPLCRAYNVTRHYLHVHSCALGRTGHYGGGAGDNSSSSGGELEAGELVIDDSYTHLSKKKKKSKKSKKKKDKEKDRDKEKSGKDKKHSKGFGGELPVGLFHTRGLAWLGSRHGADLHSCC